MKRFFTLAAALLLPLMAQAQAQKPLTAQQYLDRMAKQKALKGTLLGVTVRGADGKTLASCNQDLRLTPASNLKLITTGCALHQFGADYRFETRLGYTGCIDGDGTLHGDLYIIGGGDPTTGAGDKISTPADALFGQWEKLLRQAGIKRIDGRIIGNGHSYEGHLEHASWNYDDLGTYYGAGMNALCFYENAIDFDVSATREGEPVSFVQTYPETPWAHTGNYSFTGPAGSGNSLYLFTTDLAPYAELRGTFAVDRDPKTEHFANKYGDLSCSFEFFKSLQADSLEVTGGYARVNRSGRIEGPDFVPQESAGTPEVFIGRTKSPKLEDIARETNWRSDNFYAEALLRAMGEKETGYAVYDSCAVARKNVLDQLKLSTDGIQLVDGSGLSRANYVSARWLADFLDAMKKSPAFPAFLSSLPAPGQGTLKVVKLGEGADKVRMKSGSMNGVLCYSGYILDEEGNPSITFSILTNNAVAPMREVRAALAGFLDFLLSL
ncbi:MAG: D-alanyl-D-alanine carboxypeptidase/D-alanyl-D-alanine-endopeptidase [Bacteroidales bacterium]|nr:D-alanyl-D-alanine carboxypeptidase/D-alanyl-D-alanine-endopeptidase [Bacteroidales bacterium]